MKIYSSDTVSSAEVDAKVSSVRNQVSAVDAKQTEQIQKLRVLLAVSFAVNLLVAIGAYFA